MNDARKQALAYEIADALNDRHAIDIHLGFANKYTEEYLRGNLEYVLSRPAESITSNRAAYYVYLVKKNGGSIRR